MDKNLQERIQMWKESARTMGIGLEPFIRMNMDKLKKQGKWTREDASILLIIEGENNEKTNNRWFKNDGTT